MKHIAGIIGFGGMANYHFDQLKDYERMDFKGVYDVDPSREKIALE